MQPWGEWGVGNPSVAGDWQEFVGFLTSLSLLQPPEEGRSHRTGVCSCKLSGDVPAGWEGWVCRRPNLSETLKEPREMWIDRYNPELHYLVSWFSFVSVQQIDL